MTHESQDDLRQEISDLLDDERDALVRGDLDRLGVLFARKESLFARLGDAAIPAGDIGALRSKALNNQVLLDNALAGIRDVADRIGAVRRLRQSLDTYDAKGHRQTIGAGPAHKLERRA